MFDGGLVVLSASEYDMGVVDNLCSPGWEKDLMISVLSLDRQYEFKVVISPDSLPLSFWLRRKYGYEDFTVRKSLGQRMNQMWFAELYERHYYKFVFQEYQDWIKDDVLLSSGYLERNLWRC